MWETEPTQTPSVMLLQQASHAALAGHYPAAKRMLTKAWSSAGSAEDAGAAAWALAWVLMQEQNFAHAITWFERANIGSKQSAQLWPCVQAMIVRHCRSAIPDETSAHSQLPALEILTLGQFQIRRGDQALPMATARKPLAVLRYLLSRPQRRAHRDELAEALWPQAASADAAHSLHVAVAALRRYLDPPEGSYLLYENGYYLLNPQARIAEDTRAFQELLAQAEQARLHGEAAAATRLLCSALASYTGEYTVDERDGTWALAERERLLAHYLGALDTLGRLHCEQGNCSEAAECFRLLLERDTYREDACTNLIRCYLALGRRHDALRAFEACSQALRLDLGLDPSPGLQAVYQELLG